MKHTYELSDQATFYFVTHQEEGFSEPSIKAFTDDKTLLDFYLKFHGLKSFKVNPVTDTYKSIITMINTTCRNDEIDLQNLITADRDNLHHLRTGKSHSKKDNIIVTLPITTAERVIIDDGSESFCSGLVDYGSLNNVIGWLKKKYLQSLRDIGLIDIIAQTVMNHPSKLTRSITIDEVMVLLKSFPADFG